MYPPIPSPHLIIEMVKLLSQIDGYLFLRKNTFTVVALGSSRFS